MVFLLAFDHVTLIDIYILYITGYREATGNIHRKIPVLNYLFDKVAGLRDCCKTFLVHAH